MRTRGIYIALQFILLSVIAAGQISPGDLANAHADLEGIMNCTQCHVLGGGVSDQKCLDCHEELKVRIEKGKGYHASEEVRGQNCVTCHSDHYGRDFDMVRFNENDFKHQLTGYVLTGRHAGIDCRQCHTPDLIRDADLKNNTSTYLGLGTDCLSCHEDVHRNTLPDDCASCHTTDAFSPAGNFNHNNTSFVLKGQHRNVACVRCHPVSKRDGADFQRFTGISFGNCTSCHTDVHQNKFGNNCTECHTEQSFAVAGYSRNFDHNMTGFKLTGRHRYVECRQCHEGNFTEPLPHNTCASCHMDYHKREFATSKGSPDCAECHTVNGFSENLYTIEQHNQGAFVLEGAHLATPCFACHRQSTRWRFRDVGEQCVDCHTDVHAGYMDEKYYAGHSCENCHVVAGWHEIQFDHNLTRFELAGAHALQDCISCHGPGEKDEVDKFASFSNLSMECDGCHQDVHHNQFVYSGTTACQDCHGFESWIPSEFNHNETAFKLDGKHAETNCTSCHKEVEEEGEIYVFYKIKKFECVDCHQ